MVIVLTSVGLPPDDVTLIVAIDWILQVEHNFYILSDEKLYSWAVMVYRDNEIMLCHIMKKALFMNGP